MRNGLNDLIAVIIIFGLVAAAIYLMKQHEKKKLTEISVTNYENISKKSKIVSVLKVLGIINIIVSVFLFPIKTELSAGVFISGLILFALGVLVYNSERQTEILEKILDKKDK